MPKQQRIRQAIRAIILFHIITRDAQETTEIGNRLGRALEKGMVVSLEGKLGVGKTTFVKGIAVALGIEEQITSPSYTIMSVYSAPITLYHIDLYRIDTTAEILDVGLEDVLYENQDGVAVVEWGEKAEAILPEDYIQVSFTLTEEALRSISIRGIQL